MKFAGKLATGVAAVVMTSTAAMAADVIVIPPPAPPPPVVPAPAVSPFAGLYVGGHYTRGFVNGGTNAVGAQAGYNFVNNSFLVGVEGRVGAAFNNGPNLYAEIGARAGFVVGQSFLLYGAASIGVVPNFNFNYRTLGAGVEFALGGNVSLFGEFRRVNQLNGATTFNQVTVGLNFHP
jgi:opacity protein-like surface antigen